MTIPDNPVSTLWQWVVRAPLPVVIALLMALATWVYAVDGKAGDAAKDAAVAAANRIESVRRIEKMDEKIDKLLEAVIKLQAASEEAKKANDGDRADRAAAKKKENR